MANKLITLRLGDKLLKEIDSALKHSSFENRTDFIRAAVREMIKGLKENSDASEPAEEAPGKKKGAKIDLYVEEAMEELNYVR